MAEAKQGDTVKVHYTAKQAGGDVIDASGDDAIEFTIGEGQVIPGVEEAIVGMTPGDEKTQEIPADKAYGHRHDDRILTVPRERLPEGLNPQVGQQLEVETEGGGRVQVLVTETTDADVTIDANHPLAGQDLVFDLQLVEIV